jgi:hypothetical protein
VTDGSDRFCDFAAVHRVGLCVALGWPRGGGSASQLVALYRGSFASLEAEADLRWILRARRSGVTIPLSTTRPTRIASPRTAWSVENAHTMAAPNAVPTTVTTRNMVNICRRAVGRSARNLAKDLCSSPDLTKRAQQMSTAGIISRMSRIHSTAMRQWYSTGSVVLCDLEKNIMGMTWL